MVYISGPGHGAPASAAHTKEWLKAQIMESLQYAYKESIDRAEITNWTWPA